MVFRIFLLLCLISTSYGLTADEQALLDWHNDARKKTRNGNTPCSGGNCPAGTIPDMTWSTTVATSAKAYADILANDCNGLSRGHSSTPYGENLAYAAAYPNAPGNIATIDPWVTDESPCYNYNSNSGSCVVGHFTQVVWADSTQVGCGCSTNVCDSIWNSVFCVCQYNPPGNYNGQKPYVSGGSSTGTTQAPPDTTQSNVDIGNGGNNENGIITYASTYTGFNELAWPAITTSYTQFSNTRYGPVNTYGYNMLLVYYSGAWRIINKDTLDNQNTVSTFCYCTCTNCNAANCDNWNRYIDSVSSIDGSAYSNSSSSNKKEDRLIEGLLIGLGIAIGVFLLSIFIYWCVKRRNSKKTQYNIVQMNNENSQISNHEYVEMNN